MLDRVLRRNDCNKKFSKVPYVSFSCLFYLIFFFIYRLRDTKGENSNIVYTCFFRTRYEMQRFLASVGCEKCRKV